MLFKPCERRVANKYVYQSDCQLTNIIQKQLIIVSKSTTFYNSLA